MDTPQTPEEISEPPEKGWHGMSSAGQIFLSTLIGLLVFGGVAAIVIASSSGGIGGGTKTANTIMSDLMDAGHVCTRYIPAMSDPKYESCGSATVFVLSSPADTDEYISTEGQVVRGIPEGVGGSFVPAGLGAWTAPADGNRLPGRLLR